MNDGRVQPFTEHLIELRRRLVWVVVTFVVALIVSFIYSIDVFYLIRDHAFIGKAIYARSPGDPLKVYMQISVIFAFVITFPVLMYHIWKFVRPGLHPKEQKAALMYIPVALLLFFTGLSFGYFVIFPYLIEFLNLLNTQMGLQQLYGVYDAFSFLVNIVFPLGLFFELPVIVLFLTRIGILTPLQLKKVRRFAYLILVIIAAMITPPDFISNILVSIPLILLYEISILLSEWQVNRLKRPN